MNCELITTDEHKLCDNNLVALIKDPSLQNFNPSSLAIEIKKQGSYQKIFSLNLAKYDNELVYEIECDNISLKDDIRYETEKLITSLKSNRFIQLWSNHFGILSYLFSYSLIMLLIYIAIPTLHHIVIF